ncbi:MAG: TetR/AcrR family transcriptional regulator [Thermoleophilales bacterium]|nr:TetR/AcrR family transcriptional regulator [Thermoleophilales bacterium]
MPAGLKAAEEEPPRGPGRPSSGARERVLDAAVETLLEEGYAGLTYAKVAFRSGENKSLISYYFGSKQGLVAAVADVIGERITDHVLAELQDLDTVDAIARGLITGVWQVMDEDPRMARLYFDLSAVIVVDDDVRLALHKVKDRWREVITAHLLEAGVASGEVAPLGTFLMAGVQGLAIERLEGYGPERLEAARELFIQAAGSLA